jgi:hypothetical protein
VTAAKQQYRIQVIVRAPWYKKPLVPLFEMLFRAGAAMDVGRTTVIVTDLDGRVLLRREFGRDRAAAHRFRRLLEIDLDALGPDEFREKYQIA